jgi:chromosomal replication initiation ATPase DnaA
MKAIMFRELSPRELQIYRTGFKNGYRLAETHLIYKSQAMADKIKMREDRERIKKQVEYKHPVGYETFNKILYVVASHFNVSTEEVMSRRRLAYMVKPRAVIINYILEHFQISTPKLGMFFNYDHSTIIHYRRQKVKQSGMWKPLEFIWKDYEIIKKELAKS